MNWTFTFGIRIDRDLLDEEKQTLEGTVLPGGTAHDTAKVSLQPGWGNPLTFDKDIAHRLSAPLAVTFLGWDSDERTGVEPGDDSAFFSVTVMSEDYFFLRGLALTAADEWEEGDVSDYGFRQVEEGA
jgi:hypothetical protein